MKILRAYTRDAPMPLKPTGARCARDAVGPAQRTLICSFAGSGFVAEREDGKLNIYLVTGEPFATATTGDSRKAGVTAADLQARNESLYPRQKGHTR